MFALLFCLNLFFFFSSLVCYCIYKKYAFIWQQPNRSDKIDQPLLFVLFISMSMCGKYTNHSQIKYGRCRNNLLFFSSSDLHKIFCLSVGRTVNLTVRSSSSAQSYARLCGFHLFLLLWQYLCSYSQFNHRHHCQTYFLIILIRFIMASALDNIMLVAHFLLLCSRFCLFVCLFVFIHLLLFQDLFKHLFFFFFLVSFVCLLIFFVGHNVETFYNEKNQLEINEENQNFKLNN